MISRKESKHLRHQGGRKQVTRQGQAGDSFISCIIGRSVHLEKTVLDVSVRIGRRSSDEVQHLHRVRLRHGLNYKVKLGLTTHNSLEAELRFRLDQPGLDVIWPERRELHSNSHEAIDGRENGGSSLGSIDGSRIPGIAAAERETLSSF